ncbi:ankyrin repeat domain-containing protein [Actinacidiphila oryziradicis]|uniref:ankyrin repeat domain-containing protein n=1 Tax=Actinacidiphila oryziradicis TaxID=2571141 RepID=UPI001FED166E|nr:ankyrin repeat domain-containing protein [Actinacidiphila oryziradicis]
MLDADTDPNEMWSHMSLILHAIDVEADGAVQNDVPLNVACTAVLLPYGADPGRPCPQGEIPLLFSLHYDHEMAVGRLEAHIARRRNEQVLAG